MFRTVNDQPTLWDSILPPELLVLPVDLGQVDALLDDPVLFAPFAADFDAWIGRPSIPTEAYLRSRAMSPVRGWPLNGGRISLAIDPTAFAPPQSSAGSHCSASSATQRDATPGPSGGPATMTSSSTPMSASGFTSVT